MNNPSAKLLIRYSQTEGVLEDFMLKNNLTPTQVVRIIEEYYTEIILEEVYDE